MSKFPPEYYVELAKSTYIKYRISSYFKVILQNSITQPLEEFESLTTQLIQKYEELKLCSHNLNFNFAGLTTINSGIKTLCLEINNDNGNHWEAKKDQQVEILKTTLNSIKTIMGFLKDRVKLDVAIGLVIMFYRMGNHDNKKHSRNSGFHLGMRNFLDVILTRVCLECKFDSHLYTNEETCLYCGSIDVEMVLSHGWCNTCGCGYNTNSKNIYGLENISWSFCSLKGCAIECSESKLVPHHMLSYGKKIHDSNQQSQITFGSSPLTSSRGSNKDGFSMPVPKVNLAPKPTVSKPSIHKISYNSGTMIPMSQPELFDPYDEVAAEKSLNSPERHYINSQPTSPIFKHQSEHNHMPSKTISVLPTKLPIFNYTSQTYPINRDFSIPDSYRTFIQRQTYDEYNKQHPRDDLSTHNQNSDYSGSLPLSKSLDPDEVDRYNNRENSGIISSVFRMSPKSAKSNETSPTLPIPNSSTYKPSSPGRSSNSSIPFDDDSQPNRFPFDSQTSFGQSTPLTRSPMQSPIRSPLPTDSSRVSRGY